MSYLWGLIFLQSIFLGYLLLSTRSEQTYPHIENSLERLRESACNSALLSKTCKDFKEPDLESCRIGFSFSALIDIRVRFTDFSKYFLPPNQGKSHEVIHGKQDMLEALAYGFSTGRAAEFRVPQELFVEVLTVLEKLESWRTLGGNGATMANRAAYEGCSTFLVAPVTSEMLEYFPSTMDFLSTFLEEPDFHIILEYREGETWGKYTAPRSNRFYMNHDLLNVNPEVLDPGFQLNNTQILVIGGLQLIENSESEDLFLAKVLLLSTNAHEKNIKVHIEMGDFHSYSYFKKLQSLFATADSIGMNEQELGILLCHLKKIKFAGYPSKAPLKKYLADLSDLIKQLESSQFLTSRIHLHTISSQVICSTDIWDFPLIPASRSAIIAGQYACNNTDIQSNSFRFYDEEDWKNEDITKCWRTNNMQCCLALVPTCTNVVQVSGLGDNISATGLVYHKIK